MSQNLVVIGTGLIGSSLAKAAKATGAFDTVWAINRSAETCEQVKALGVADQAVTYEQLPQVIDQLGEDDIVVVAVPVSIYESIFFQLKPLLPEGVVLTDVGSSKVSVVEAAKSVWGASPAFFVPGHPIAGSEKKSVTAVNPDLFKSRRCILTPLPETGLNATSLISSFWESIGANVDIMDMTHHDEVLAATSHLPHVLAYALVDALCTLDQKTEVFRYAAGGFRDFTRIAESDPLMWRDILLSNRKAILKQLDNFESHLSELRAAIENSDAECISSILERAQSARKLFSETQEKS